MNLRVYLPKQRNIRSLFNRQHFRLKEKEEGFPRGDPGSPLWLRAKGTPAQTIDLIKATPLGDRLSALHAIFRQIFRHFLQNLLEIRQYSCVDFVNLTKNYARNLTRNFCAVLP